MRSVAKESDRIRRRSGPIPPPPDLTRLLKRIAEGDKEAEEQLFPLVYTELRQLARRHMAGEAKGHLLQTTAVVNEAYLRMKGPGHIKWENRGHFFAVAARAMRRVLVDFARGRRAEKRGGAANIIETLDFEPASLPVESDDILALDEALKALAALDARKCQIVELRYYTGLTIEETATTLDISPRTVKREWRLARAWLLKKLNSA